MADNSYFRLQLVIFALVSASFTNIYITQPVLPVLQNEFSADMVTVSLKDEGPGIPVKVQEKIFDRFYTIGKRHGTGLGLAICKGIIEAHNGTISVSSIPGEKGCTFYFTLPKPVHV